MRGARRWRGARRAAGALAGCAALAWPAPSGGSAGETTFVASRRVHPEGLSLLQEERRRTPTGLLYPYPFAPPPLQPLGEDWGFRGFWEVGGSESWGGSDEAYFEEYADLIDGVRSALRLELRHAPTGGYLELGATDLGRDDASAFAETGVWGRLRVRGFLEETPHRYAHDARPLHLGVGSESLVLPPPLVASASSEAQVDAALAATDETRIAVFRDAAGVDVRARALPGLELRGGYRLEERRGERPFGGAIRFTFQSPALGSLVETVEPRDARTHDFHGGLAWASRWAVLDLEYTGSVFDAEHRSLTWENPFSLPGTAVDRGRFALAPDNAAHRAAGTLSWLLPANARWTHTLAWTTARQDERLLAPTLNPAFPDWTDAATALSRTRADARVDTTVATSSLRLSPLRSLRLGATGRFLERDNRTDYFAANPATGSFGYVIEDGSFGVRERFGAAPFDEQRWSVEGDASWTPFARTSLGIEYVHEEVERDERARERTREDRGRISLSTRRLRPATVRLAYELSERDGSSFDRQRGAVYYSAGPPAFAPAALGTPQRSLAGFEPVDLADRLEQRGSARVSLLLGGLGDLGVAAGVTDQDFDSRFGVRGARAADAHLELSVQPAPQLDAYAFGGIEWRRRRLSTITPSGPNAAPDATFEPGGPEFPLANGWTTRATSETVTAGGGLAARPVTKVELRADYLFAITRERQDYAFAGPGALAPGVTADAAGSRFPHLRHAEHILDASAELGVTDWLALRLLYRFHRARVRDYQQTDLATRIGHAVYLGHVDGDFIAHVLGAMVKVRF